jgi:tRNA(fMet)-specific endonuclease VapC
VDVSVLLDTSAYVALARGDRAVAQRVRDAERLIFSVVVVGELLAGFRRSARAAENRERLNTLLESAYVDLLPVGPTTADRYARIMAALREAGRPIPTNDVWIAAHTMESGATLLTLDRHFEAVPGLVWEHPGRS